ncbi:polysaccharide export protein [Qipengyuania sp. YG27]|uniref:Polysaccharide export protein n=1 Tax=Qipengyuania mesophila TaxID=2867246 RepID=A0ABS7JQW8_9SPHN|nr:polysaccharide biosynthesis/export family protein [Qipengyuania mesophila]MBX7500035.1 polysaccharide export protein [Qipengyuania mesophila]
MSKIRSLFPLLCLGLLAGCFNPGADLARGDAAYEIIPPQDPERGPPDYRIGVLDTLSVRVFQEPELTFETLQVDASGTINFPLVGQVDAAGKTAIELSEMLEAGLGARFIRDPQVVVGVVSSAAQRVVVEGSVTEPGVYEIAGTSSLLEAIARAKGPTITAVEDEVIVFRQIDGQQYGAIFNLRHIREGRVPDPEILGGDRIVVGFSAVKGLYQDFLRAAPIFNIFTRF